MKYKNTYTIAFFLWMAAVTGSCTDQFDNADQADKIEKMTIIVQADVNVSGLPAPEYLKVQLNNYSENLTLDAEMDASGKAEISGVIPGLYSISIDGKTSSEDGSDYYLNGNAVNYPIVSSDKPLDISVRALVAGKLIFKEIYYSGSRPATGGVYFRDQFYEIYNNTENVIYLDKLYMGHLHPTTATTKLPVWPEEDGDDYVYAQTLWQFPGNGTDYPLKPGESCILAQAALNHQQELFNPNSPVDCSSAEFEFYNGFALTSDQSAVNMNIVYNDGTNELSIPFYLTSVFGGAYVLFQVPEDVDYRPWIGNKWQTVDLSSSSNTLYARVPVDYILDVVECGTKQSDLSGKRVPGFLDAGMTWVGGSYVGKSVARKMIGTRPDGSPIFQDTNNSTQDFEIQDTPQLRRYGVKMPAWNHLLVTGE